jgi:hypothetical protein
LRSTRGVLLAALLLERLGADDSADGFLARADGLVPGAFAAVRVVFGDGAGGGGREGPDFGGCVRGVVFEFGFGFLGFAGVLGGLLALFVYLSSEYERAYLISGATGQAAESRLNCTGGRVDVRLKSGGFLVRHDCLVMVACLYICLVGILKLSC